MPATVNVSAGPEQWLTFIQRELSVRPHQPRASRGTPFYKAPIMQRQENPKAFDPVAFAFGPYHASFNVGSDVDHCKLDAVKWLVHAGSFDKLLKKIEEQMPSIRALYVEARDHLTKIDTRSFTYLLALDAVAIVVYFVNVNVFRSPVASKIPMDAILLENQIPLSLLQYAMESMDTEVVKSVTLQTIVRTISKMYSPFCRPPEPSGTLSSASPPEPPITLSSASDNSQSLLSVIYYELCRRSGSCNSHDRSLSEASTRDYDTFALRTASHLRRCGIRFKPCYGNCTAITFDKQKGILQLPRIKIYDSAERFFLNLFAYEATSISENCKPITSYVLVMDHLLNKEEDVRLLVECGVIENYLGSEKKLARMWNKVGVEVPLHLTREDQTVVEEVNNMSKIRWRKWKAAFKETYWENKPWLLVSLVAATLLLILTFLQTLYAIKATKK